MKRPDEGREPSAEFRSQILLLYDLRDTLAVARAAYAASSDIRDGLALMGANEQYEHCYRSLIFDELALGHINTDVLPFVYEETMDRNVATHEAAYGEPGMNEQADIDELAKRAEDRLASELAKIIDPDRWEDVELTAAERNAAIDIVMRHFQEDIAAEHTRPLT
jgi:hypothetical protein